MDRSGLPRPDEASRRKRRHFLPGLSNFLYQKTKCELVIDTERTFLSILQLFSWLISEIGLFGFKFSGLYLMCIILVVPNVRF